MSTQSILAPEGAPVLASFATSNVLLAFDYDGTLAPIASTPARARLRHSTRELLDSVARRYPAVVISGRALADISRRLADIPLWYVFGNHGSEPVTGAPPSGRTREWARILQRELPHDPALSIEDKGHTVTVHYRGARDRAQLRQAIMAVAARLPEVRVVGGSEAINLLRRDAPNKGVALAYALKTFACDVALYAGDDDTDEDAFGALARDRLLSIRVGRPAGATRARFHLESQHDIDELLDRLVRLRHASTRSRAAGR